MLFVVMLVAVPVAALVLLAIIHAAFADVLPPFWREAFAIVPLAATWCAMSYVAHGGGQCYVHEGVGWTGLIIGAPNFLLSLVGLVLFVFDRSAKSALRVLIRLGIVIAVPIAYVLPFSVDDQGRLMDWMLCGVR